MSATARAVSAEVRARLARQRLAQRDFALAAGFGSQNYVSIRLRDASPFTLSDLDLIAEFFGTSPLEFIQSVLRDKPARVHPERTARSAMKKTEVWHRRELLDETTENITRVEITVGSDDRIEIDASNVRRFLTEAGYEEERS